MNYEMRFIRTNNVTLHTILAGNETGEPVILLHGFPEFWYGWRNQIPFLAEQGYRVIVPDGRGYNLSEKPRHIGDYRISTLAADVKGIVEAFGYEKVNLVGHDWGGAAAWWVATLFPERLKKLVVLNCPYPTIMLEAVRGLNVLQILRGSYFGFFQLPFLPEAMLSFNNYAALVNGLRITSRHNAFTDIDLVHYREAWRQPGALKAMLNWYRATLQSTTHNDVHVGYSTTRITMPTLLLWGERDMALGSELARPSIDLCENGKLVYFPDATHWLHHEEPNTVNQHIHEFLGQV